MRGTKIGLIVALIALVAPACNGEDDGAATESLSSPIVGGTLTEDFPFAVALLEDGSMICSGTLIERRVVLTAAHCFDQFAGELTVFIGANARQPASGTLMEVDGWETHPSYDPVQLRNDIAVVQLTSEAPAAPATVVDEDEFGADFVGQDLRLIGFGAINPGGAGAGMKRMVDIPLVQVGPRLMLFSDPGHNACYGDSGGGGFVQIDGHWKLAGVTSYGDQHCRQWGASMRAGAYESWVTQFLSDPEAHETPEPNAVELAAGTPLITQVQANAQVYMWFPTHKNNRYDVIVEALQGEVETFVDPTHYVGPSQYECAAEANAGAVGWCEIPDGGEAEYWIQLRATAEARVRVTVVQSDPDCHGMAINGQDEYVYWDCQGAPGEGNCLGEDIACADGLVCAAATGADWGMPPHIDVCTYAPLTGAAFP